MEVLKIEGTSLAYLKWVHTEFCNHPGYPQNIVQKQREILDGIEKRNKRNHTNDRVLIKASDLDYFEFREENFPPTPSSQEQWQTFSLKGRYWLEKRMKSLERFIVPNNEDENTTTPCFFCGKETKHYDYGGNAWWADILTPDGKTVIVLYCDVIKHSGKEACPQSEEAYNKALWEEDTCRDVIGFQGHKYNMMTNPPAKR